MRSCPGAVDGQGRPKMSQVPELPLRAEITLSPRSMEAPCCRFGRRNPTPPAGADVQALTPGQSRPPPTTLNSSLGHWASFDQADASTAAIGGVRLSNSLFVNINWYKSKKTHGFRNARISSPTMLVGGSRRNRLRRRWYEFQNVGRRAWIAYIHDVLHDHT